MVPQLPRNTLFTRYPCQARYSERKHIQILLVLTAHHRPRPVCGPAQTLLLQTLAAFTANAPHDAGGRVTADPAAVPADR